MATKHIPVLLHEVKTLLNPQPGEVIVDGTLGGGGHTKMFREAMGDKGKLIVFDRDENALVAFEEWCRNQKIGKSFFIPVHNNFNAVLEELTKRKIKKIDKMLCDLGLSSDQFEESGRGFSFLKDEPLDMRYNPEEETMTAGELVNSLPEKELADVIFRYGEERHSRVIAHALVLARRKKRISSSHELAEVIRILPFARHTHLHPATKTFMALRIAVNHELESLQDFLNSVPSIIQSRGRLAIISFHSLEDRIVKNSFREIVKRGIGRFITKKPIIPSKEEIRVNPKSRSAKLRVIEFI